jgi:hypothetical protein
VGPFSALSYASFLLQSKAQSAHTVPRPVDPVTAFTPRQGHPLSAHLEPTSKKSTLNQVAVRPPVQMPTTKCRLNCFVLVSASRKFGYQNFASCSQQNPRNGRSLPHLLSEDVGVPLLREFLHRSCQRSTCQVRLLLHLEPFSDVLVQSDLQLRSRPFCERHTRVQLFLQDRKGKANTLSCPIWTSSSSRSAGPPSNEFCGYGFRIWLS